MEKYLLQTSNMQENNVSLVGPSQSGGNQWLARPYFG